MPDDLPISVIEEDDAGNTIEVLARCNLLLIGKGAFHEAVKLRPRSHLILKDGIRVIDRYSPPK